MSEILPCPFCGSTDISFEDDAPQYHWECRTCDTIISSPFPNAYNTRSTTPPRAMRSAKEWVDGTYTGSMEELIERVQKDAIRSASAVPEGRCLPELPEGWRLSMLKHENSGNWYCCLWKDGENDFVDAYSPTPRSAVINALAKIAEEGS